MSYTITRKDEFIPALWGGGSTTELFIHPRGATAATRNFEIRVSSATVEQEESVFSDFSGFARHIAPLAGTMRLEHQGHHSILLHPYETDSFNGDWTTRSFGKCVDFNLIHRPGWQGSIRKITEAVELVPSGTGYMGIYAVRETLALVRFPDGETVEEFLAAGDFLCLESAEDAVPSCRLTGETDDGECFAVAALAFR